MSALDYFETKKMLEEIAMERGQYCYDFLKNLEADRDKWKRCAEGMAKVVDAAEDVLMALELPGDHCELEQAKPVLKSALDALAKTQGEAKG